MASASTESWRLFQGLGDGGSQRNDISSALANATIDGEPIPPFEPFSLFFLLMVAGHDTTRNGISGGLLALLGHRDELEKLKRDPSLMDTAVDEIVRWATPVNHISARPPRTTSCAARRFGRSPGPHSSRDSQMCSCLLFPPCWTKTT